MSYIYVITNLINQKQYIGYTSRTITRRFYEHIWEAYDNNDEEKSSALHNAIRKYGSHNFIIEQVKEFDENEFNWEEMEKHYIKVYNSLSPGGYNICEGGNKPPIHYGDQNCKTKVSDTDLQNLFIDLKNLSLSYKDIAIKYNISVSQLYKINSGKARVQSNIKYPIRKYSQQEEYALKVINILANDKTLSNSKIAELIPNYFRANEIASINNGNKYAYLWDGEFPIRKETVPNDYLEKQIIAKHIIEYIKSHNALTQIKIQKELGYGRRIVEKVIKGEYPYCLSNQTYPIQLNK